MRKNTATRHLGTIVELLLKHGKVDMYFLAGAIGVSPSYAYQLIRMFMSNPLVHKEMEKRGICLYWDGKVIKLINKEISIKKYLDDCS